MKKIAVIGAGFGGLHTALAFQESLNLEKYEFVVYERMGKVGGLWNFSEDVGTDSSDGLPVHSPIYRNLMTNTPNDLVELPFTDYFKDEAKYVSWERYLEANNQLAEEYDLYKYIKFYHYIKSVKKLQRGFKLEIKNTSTNEEFSEEFDFVVVAAGRYNIPKWPKAENKLLENFAGRYFHSKDIKDTNLYVNDRVLCIGSGISALDISLLLHKAGAPNVVINSKLALFTKYCTHKWADNYSMVQSPIKAVDGKKIIFENGISEEFDTVIACTGYLCEYPFLEPKLRPENRTVAFPHLYDAIVHTKYPELTFVGAFYSFHPKFSSYGQGHYIANMLNKNLTNLPSEEEMEKSIEEWYNNLPKEISIIGVVDFHFNYYDHLQTFCPHKIVSKRHRKYTNHFIPFLLAGKHLEYEHKSLKDFDDS